MRYGVLTALLGATIVVGSVAAMAGDHGGYMGHKGAFVDFDATDTDKDGKLSKEELQARHSARYAEMDADGDGLLSEDELRAGMQARANDNIEARLKKMMGKRDADKDGLLSEEEMKPPRMGRMFERLDTDDDGLISREELEAMKDRMGKKKSKG